MAQGHSKERAREVQVEAKSTLTELEEFPKLSLGETQVELEVSRERSKLS